MFLIRVRSDIRDSRVLGRSPALSCYSVTWVKCRVGRAERYEVSGAKPTLQYLYSHPDKF